MISNNVEVAIEGSKAYGTTVSAAVFEPNCEAYMSATNGNGNGSVSFSANATDGSNTFAMLNFSPLDSSSNIQNPFPLELYQNITNQPIFANGTQCDRQIRLFNSTLNQGAYAPVPVKGTISSNIFPMDAIASQGLAEVYGMLIDTPFIEYNGLDCQSLKGYSGTGPGD